MFKAEEKEEEKMKKKKNMMMRKEGENEIELEDMIELSIDGEVEEGKERIYVGICGLE